MYIDINIITPVGTLEGLDDTILSISNVSKISTNIRINHFLVVNNLIEREKVDKKIKNFSINSIIIDINPICSRSLARNKGLDAVSCQNINSYVMFLDVGDELKPDAINMIKNQKEVSSDNLIFICKSCINFNRKSKPINIPLYPLWLRYVVNPFLIGGIIVSVKLAKKEYFYDGKKEDWIYWISLLNLKPQLVYIDSINFIYNIFNISDHYDKKWRSFIELRTILVEKLKWNTFLSYPISLLHILLVSYRWIYLRISNQIY